MAVLTGNPYCEISSRAKVRDRILDDGREVQYTRIAYNLPWDYAGRDQCCDQSDMWHRLDELGSAWLTYCASCRTVVAEAYLTPDGRRRWRDARTGTTARPHDDSGPNANRPPLLHTCGSASDLPCPACLRQVFGHRGSMATREAFGYYN